jgi:glucose-1-phosphate adenylyltransferase
MSNGCEIEGTVENSVIGRGCIIKRGAVVKNCVVLTTAVIGEGVHIEGQVVDKNAQVIHRKEIISDPAHPGYIRRCDKI